MKINRGVTLMHAHARHAQPKGRHMKPKPVGEHPNRRRNTIGGVILAMLASFVLGSPIAQAHDGHHADASWASNNADAGTTIVGPHTVELVTHPEETPLGTSVETVNLGLSFSDGTTISFEHEKTDGTGCNEGDHNDVRVFIYVDGVQWNSWNDKQNEHENIGAKCGEDGTVTFDVPGDGEIGHAGVVMDGEPPEPGTVRVSNLKIDGEPISFRETATASEEPTTEQDTCLAGPDGEIVLPDTEGVSYDPSDGPEGLFAGDYTVEATPVKGYEFDGDSQKVEYDVTVTAEDCTGDDGQDGSDGDNGQDGSDSEPKTSDKNCTDFDDLAAVVFHLTQYPGDFDRMDGDDDGYACNSYFGDGADSPDEDDIDLPSNINTGR